MAKRTSVSLTGVLLAALVQDAAGKWSVFGDNMGTELVMQSEAGVPLASSDDLSALDAFTLRFHNCG